MLALGGGAALELSRRRNWRSGRLRRPPPRRTLGPSPRPRPRADAHRRRTAAGRSLHPHDRRHLRDVAKKTRHDHRPRSEGHELLGMVSDGDLRRLLERDGSHALEHTAAEIMNPHPRTIQGSALASTALALMEEKKITSLIVVSASGQVEGVVHLHDLWALQLN